MTNIKECPQCHRKSEIVPLDIVCPFCIASDATKAERERMRQKLISLKRVEAIIAVARRNIVPKNLQHIPLSDDEWMKGKSKVECVNEVYQWVIDILTPLAQYRQDLMSEVEKERHKTVCPRRAGSGMCECGKHYRGLSVHITSVRNRVIAFSEKGKLWHDKEHPKETAKVHETYFNK